MTGFNLIDDLGFLLSEYYSTNESGEAVLTDIETADAITAEIKTILENDTTGILDRTYESYEDFVTDWDIFISTVDIETMLPSITSVSRQSEPAWFARIKDFFDTVEDVQSKGEDTVYQIYDDALEQSRYIYVDVLDSETSLDVCMDMMCSGIEQYFVVYDISSMTAEAIADIDDPAEAKTVIDASYRIEMQDNLVSGAYEVLDKVQGRPYFHGGKSIKSGFDCTGFVWFVFKQEGLEYSYLRSKDFKTESEKQMGSFVEVTEPMPGDVICFPGHVGIMTSVEDNNMRFVHSSGQGAGSGVHETSLSDDGHWSKQPHKFYRHRSLVE